MKQTTPELRRRKAISRIRNSPNKLSEKYPELYRNVLFSVKYPELDKSELTSSPNQLLQWKCKCGKIFSGLLYNKIKTGYVECSECNKRTQIVTRLTNMSNDRKLKYTHPDLFKQARKCISYPELSLNDISTQASQVIQWECKCGKFFNATPKACVKAKQVLCRSCRQTGQSLFEFEVKELLLATWNLEIKTHYSPDSSPKVDLYVPKLDLAIQLDPYWSHKNRTGRDIDIFEKHKKIYSKIIRYREEPLKDIDGCFRVKSGSKAKEWYHTIVKSLDIPSSPLNEGQWMKAIEKANLAWSESFRVKDGNITTLPFFEEFVKNIDRPGRKPESMGGQSSDKCLWRCKNGHEWITSPANRNRKSTGEIRGCVECWRTNALLAKPGADIASLIPTSAKEFILNIDKPIRLTTNMRENVTDNCIWECSICGELLKTTVMSRMRSIKDIESGTRIHKPHQHGSIVSKEYVIQELNKNNVTFKTNVCSNNHISFKNSVECVKCNYELARETNFDKSIAKLHPELTEQFIYCLSKPGRTANDILLSSSELCLWRCSCGEPVISKVNVRHSMLREGITHLHRFGKINVDDPTLSVLLREHFIEFYLEQKKQKDITTGLIQKEVIYKKTNKSLADTPHIDEYIANLTHPNKSVAALSIYSKDLCLWKCDKGHEFEAIIGSRFQKNRFSECPICRNNRLGFVPPERSMNVLFPESAKEFILNLTEDERNPNNFGTNSYDECIWKCKVCSKYLGMNVRSRRRAYERINSGSSKIHRHPKESILTLDQVNKYLKEANLPVISE